MKAIVLNEYGPAEKLKLAEVPEPQVEPNGLKVRLVAASVNPIDYKIRSGSHRQFMPVSFPVILGRDASGDVVEVGAGASGFAVGDRVIGLVNHAYAEYVAAPVESWARIPSSLDPREAAALPLVGLTGAELVEEGLQLRSGQTVLVTGATGSVGRVVVFVAKAIGAKVWAGVRKQHKSDAEKLGVERVVAIDDDAESQAIPEVDAIADTVGGPAIAKLLSKVKKGGAVASVLGEPAGAKERGLTVRAVLTHPDAVRLAKLAASAAGAGLVVPISHRFRFEQAAEAHRAAEKGGSGKVLLLP